jgi:RND family efflux transporter MFP subunit
MTGESQEAEDKGGSKKRAYSIAAGVLILAAGVLLAWWMIATSPKAEPKERPKTLPLIEVASLEPSSVRVRIEAMGAVVAADEAELQAEVSGLVVWVHPEMVEGGFAAGDTVLIKIDDRDYKNALRQKRAALKAAQAELKLERGQQDIAAREWELVGGGEKGSDLDRELALRKPQLRAAQAAVDSAWAAVEKAKADLERTRIRAPWNAVIAEAKADVGDRAAPGMTLARLVATDVFRVKASVRSDQLKWLEFPGPAGPGSDVIVYPSSGGERRGRLVKLMPELESSGRMAQVLIEVTDPLLLTSDAPGARALLLDEFVRVEILGAIMENVVTIPRTALRDGGKVWLLDSDNRLQIVPVSILWGTADHVFVEDRLENGRLITSSIATPVEGMGLAVEAD